MLGGLFIIGYNIFFGFVSTRKSEPKKEKSMVSLKKRRSNKHRGTFFTRKRWERVRSYCLYSSFPLLYYPRTSNWAQRSTALLHHLGVILLVGLFFGCACGNRSPSTPPPLLLPLLPLYLLAHFSWQD